MRWDEVVVALALPPAQGAMWIVVYLKLMGHPRDVSRRWGVANYMSSAAVVAVMYLLGAQWIAAACAGANLAVAAWLYWRRKSKRRNAALLGEKSRALRDALVRRARQAAKPSPVLRPSLRGVS